MASYQLTVSLSPTGFEIWANLLDFTGATFSGTDGSNSLTGTGTSGGGGNLSTTVNGDTVVAAVEVEAAPGTLSPGSGFTLENQNTAAGPPNLYDLIDIQTTHGAVTGPNQLGWVNSVVWAGFIGAFQKSSGTSSFSQKTSGAAANSVTLTLTTPPAVGDLLVCSVIAASTETITLTDNAGNAWTQLGHSANNANGDAVFMFYVLSAKAVGAPTLMMMGMGQ